MRKIVAIIAVSAMCVLLSACACKLPETGAAAGLLQKYRSDDSVKQVLIVQYTEESNAKIRFYEKQKSGNRWKLTLETTGDVGGNGIGKVREGDGKTPCGDFAVTGAFGILPNPGTTFDYVDVKPTTFACDEDCEYYNRIIDTQQTGHDCHGEEMYAIVPEYNYGLVINYNAENVYPRGSSIFVHVRGKKRGTGGCIAMDEDCMKTILKAAEKGMRVYIY